MKGAVIPVTATIDVCTIVTYLDDVITALRRRGIPVDTGFVNGVGSHRQLTIILGAGLRGLSGATVAWRADIGWSLTSGPPRPQQWVLPLGVLADPDHVGYTIQDLAASLKTPART